MKAKYDNELPLIFSGPMIHALLERRKTQTRRKMKRPPDWIDLAHPWELAGKAPYQAGQILWVRETFVLENDSEYVSYKDPLPQDRPYMQCESDGWCYHLIPHYRATEPEPNIVPEELSDRSIREKGEDTTRWTSAMFMPRWAARILLRVTGVVHERIQDISAEDCMAEGIVQTNDGGYAAARTGECYHGEDPRIAYQKLWDTLHGEGAWDQNPWIWAVKFDMLDILRTGGSIPFGEGRSVVNPTEHPGELPMPF